MNNIVDKAIGLISNLGAIKLAKRVIDFVFISIEDNLKDISVEYEKEDGYNIVSVNSENLPILAISINMSSKLKYLKIGIYKGDSLYVTHFAIVSTYFDEVMQYINSKIKKYLFFESDNIISFLYDKEETN